MLGILRGKRVGRGEFAKPFTDGLNFCGATVLLDAKGMTFDRIDNGGRDGDPDAISTAVPGILAPVPWAHVPTAQVLLAMNDSKGGPFFADPRQVLRHAMKPLQDMGLTAVAATELEFYLLEAGTPSSRHPRVGVHPRHAQGPVRPAVRQHGRRRGRRSFPRGPVRDLRGAEHSRRRDAQGILARPVRDQPASRRERRTRRGPRRAPEARGQGGRAQARHGRELHGEALRGMGRLQHARAHQPGGRRPARTSSPARARTGRSRIRCATRSAGSRRRCRNPWRSSRRPRTPIAVTGRASSCRSRRTGDATTAALRCASRCQASRTRASSTGPGGADGNPYLVLAAILAGVHHGITNKVEPGPMVAQESIIDEKVELPVRWSAALDAFDAGKILPKYLGREVSQAVRRSAGARKRSGSTRRSATATTSGTCGPCSCAC